MEYLSVKEAAEKWGVSERYVQQCCTKGRILGAVKFGGVWAIPAQLEKPERRRKTTAEREEPSAAALQEPAEFSPLTEPARRVVMPLINTPFVPGHCREAVEQIGDPDARNIALAEYYYFSGHSSEASDLAELYLASDDVMLQLSACWIYGYANLALDRIDRARRAVTQLNTILASLDEDTPEEVRAAAICIATAASVLLHLPLPEGVPPAMQVLYLLPTGMRLMALYVQAHAAYLQKQYAASVGIAETALALGANRYPIPAIYLHLVAVMDYISLRQPDQAREHLLSAWKLARPDDLIEALGEHHGLLGGMLEVVIKKEWPRDFRRIIAITYSFSAGWRKIHNPDTGNSVADDLTTTEFAIAMLAARNWSNKEIGAHLGVSDNTVKQHLSAVFQKLGISQRKELEQFMLR